MPGRRAVEPGEIEQVGDEPAEARGVARESRLEGVPVRPGGLLAQQRLGRRLEPGDRGAQLVRGIGQELARRRLRRAGAVERLLQRVDHAVERRRHPPELGVGAARPQPAADVPGRDALGDHGDVVERAQGGSGDLPHGDDPEQQDRGADQRLDLDQPPHVLVDRRPCSPSAWR